MQVVPFFGNKLYSAYILEGFPFFLIFLSFEDSFDDLFQPFLNPQVPEWNEPSSLEGPMHAIIKESGDEKKEYF